jgi:imidazolonepropionase-like amidohydrolase
MTEFPVHVYRSPGNYVLRGKSYKLASVADQNELQAHIDAGWSITMSAAFEAAGEAAIAKRKNADWRSQKKATKRKREFKIAKAQARAEKAARDAGVPVTVTTDDNAPPTRAELEQQATLLGLKFDRRTTDKRLLERITETMKET